MDFVNAFSESLRDQIFVSFILLMWYITLIDFSSIKTALYFWDKLLLVMEYNPLYILLVPFADILKGFLHLDLQEIVVCSSCVTLLPGFGIRVILAL